MAKKTFEQFYFEKQVEAMTEPFDFKKLDQGYDPFLEIYYDYKYYEKTADYWGD